MKPADVPLSLYLHLPWCARKCPYCDFNSFTAHTTPPRARYVDAVIRDLEQVSHEAEGRELLSVFIGGGTPSLFSPAEIGTLIAAVRARFELPAGAEITMEANPGTVDCGSPAGYLEAGVNRLSVGAQSFSAAALSVLGRIHTPEAIADTFRAARDAGFDNINLDVMYGLPGQDVDAALDDLRQAAGLGPEHLSWYHLTLEPNTVFHRRPPEGLPDESLAADIQEAGQAALEGFGFSQYEVSAWAAAPERECRHNLNYWRFGDYLAVGAGAHGKLTRPEGVFRYVRPANPEAYMRFAETLVADSPGSAAELTACSADDLVFEFMLNSLRLTEGFTLGGFEDRTGLDSSVLVRKLERLRGRGLMERRTGGHFVPTALGRSFLNDVMAEFLPSGPASRRV